MSRLVRERNGYQSMPELGYNPVNHYLPPRHKPHAETTPGASLPPLSERWLFFAEVRYVINLFYRWQQC